MKLIEIMLLLLIVMASVIIAQHARAADLQGALSPDDYILSRFLNADVVLLGEDHAVKQHVEFVADLIPKLHKAGIHNLVMEFGAFEDQQALDALVTAPVFDEAVAKQLMFHYNSMWSWQEYRGLYRAAWAYNRSLASGQKPFRILNMSYVYDWSAFTGVRTPQVLKRVFSRGMVDAFRAEFIQREILDRDEKALVLTGTLHAFTRFGMPQTQSDGDGFCLKTHNALGNRLFRAHGQRITNLMFHQTLPAQPGSTPFFSQPANGEVERLMRANGSRPVGFDLRGSMLGTLREHGYYNLCDEDLILADLFDGYVFLAPFKQLTAATPDPDFINADNLQKALEQYPDPDWRPKPANLTKAREHLKSMADEINNKYRAVE